MGMDERKPSIAVLSGKGGTGKTFVAVNVAAVAGTAYYMDCDVEEPNGYLFLNPRDPVVEPVSVRVPEVDQGRCTACGRCVKFCRFHALALVKRELLVFDTICHSCGGCVLICPEQALTEREKEVGTVEKGSAGGVQVCTGILHIGEVSGLPVIDHLLGPERNPDRITIIDCPPGTACSVLESISDADYCLLVAEPTLFGLENFKMVLELVRLLGKACGVVINKSFGQDSAFEEYCSQERVPILLKIPYEERLAQLTSSGQVASLVDEQYRLLFTNLLTKIVGE